MVGPLHNPSYFLGNVGTRFRRGAPPILERLGLSADAWCELVENCGRLFHNVAGCPAVVDQVRSLRTHCRYRLSRRARQLLEAA